MNDIVLAGARVVTPAGVLDGGWVRISGERIAAVGAGAPPPAGEVLTTDGWVVPGFVDLHVHGGGGHDMTASAQDMAAAVAYHLGRGTTRTLASLMAAPIDDLCGQLTWVADLAGRSTVVGAHLEGPFLAAARCGAQNVAHLLPPDPPVLRKLLDAAPGAVRTITIAPEMPGALALIEETVSRGAVAAIGHTDAGYEQARAAFASGAALATHLFNAMGSMSQRAPGAAIAALDSGAYVEVINDGVHVHPALVRLAATLAPDRLALVTDAISATGVGDGRYPLGDRDVEVHDGQARLRGSDRLAGSTLTMDVAFRRLVTDVGLPVEAAVAAASANPARLLGLEAVCGAVAPGLDADLVLLSGALEVRRVMAGGRWV